MIDKGTISALVDTYRRAALALDGVTDPVERELGQATLRLNAISTLSHVASKSIGVAEEALSSLRQWIQDYSGSGDVAPKVVNQIDSTLKDVGVRALKEVAGWAWNGNAMVLGVGVFGTIFGVGLTIVDIGHQAGSALITALLTGAIPGSVIYLAIRSGSQAGPAIARGVRTTWTDASALGSVAEKVLLETCLPAERVVWAAVGGKPYPGVPFIARARTRARWIVGSAIVIAGIGLALFLIGVVRAYNEWQEAQALALVTWQATQVHVPSL